MPKMNRSEFAHYMATEFPIEDKRREREHDLALKQARAESRRLRDSLFPIMGTAFIEAARKNK